LRDLHLLSPLGYENVVSGMLYILYMWVCPWLVPEFMDGFYPYLLFKRVSITGQCPVNMNIQAPKLEALQMGIKTENGSNNFDW
jgi:hypothetical protein